jgi:hypothetical protein
LSVDLQTLTCEPARTSEKALIRIQSDGWKYDFNNKSATVFLTSLRTEALAPEATFTQCCVNCAAIMRTDCQIDVSDLIAASSDCVVCAFLLRAAEPHWRHENRGCYITRDKSALTIGDDGRRFLGLGTTLGKCISPICTTQTTYLLRPFFVRVLGCA